MIFCAYWTSSDDDDDDDYVTTKRRRRRFEVHCDWKTADRCKQRLFDFLGKRTVTPIILNLKYYIILNRTTGPANVAWRVVKEKKNENAYHAPKTSRRVSPLREDEKKTVQRKSVARGSFLIYIYIILHVLYWSSYIYIR